MIVHGANRHFILHIATFCILRNNLECQQEKYNTMITLRISDIKHICIYIFPFAKENINSLELTESYICPTFQCRGMLL